MTPTCSCRKVAIGGVFGADVLVLPPRGESTDRQRLGLVPVLNSPLVNNPINLEVATRRGG